MPNELDIHEGQLLTQYLSVQPQFELVARHVRELIATQLGNIKIQNIEHRAKNSTSFLKKCHKLDDNDSAKYDDPFNQITDIAGVRVICFVNSDVDKICDIVLKTFSADNIEDVGERIFQKGRFGYQSKHILVNLTKSTYLPECSYIHNVYCEVQVRTLLQHAWAEMEHDIQYKGETVPDTLRRRFLALAGLLDIADGEFERIQQHSNSINSRVEAELISHLTVEGFAESESPESIEGNASSTFRSVRSMIANGDFGEALSAYNQKILDQPSAYTLYIGRAKVRFLLGDSDGAILDLDRAAAINSVDSAIPNLRSIIESGDLDAAKLAQNDTNIDSQSISTAFNLLSDGQGVAAFAEIIDLESRGYNKAFAIFNKAMCCLLEDDIGGCRDFVSSLSIFAGTPMSVNISILNYFCDIVILGDDFVNMDAIRAALEATPHYRIEQSAMMHLLNGIGKRNPEFLTKIQAEFEATPQLAFDIS